MIHDGGVDRGALQRKRYNSQYIMTGVSAGAPCSGIGMAAASCPTGVSLKTASAGLSAPLKCPASHS